MLCFHHTTIVDKLGIDWQQMHRTIQKGLSYYHTKVLHNWSYNLDAQGCETWHSNCFGD